MVSSTARSVHPTQANLMTPQSRSSPNRWQLRENHPYAHAARLPEGDALTFDELLPGSGPLEVEVGPGRGTFLFERCEAAPAARLVAFEIRLKWAAIVGRAPSQKWARRPSARFADDARAGLARLGPDASVERAFLHFPDPWWKKRHTKRLVMGNSFLDEIARLLRDEGELFVQTDVEARFEEYRALLDAHPLLAPAGDRAGDAWMADNPYGARSNREHRAIADGLPVHRLRYQRRVRT